MLSLSFFEEKGQMKVEKSALLLFLLVFFANTGWAKTYPMPASGDDVVGKEFVIETKKGDTWESLSRQYHVSWYALHEANQKRNPKKLWAHQKIRIPDRRILPSYRKGIVINISELILYYFMPDGKSVKIYPVTLGRRGWRTPLGLTYIVSKKEKPTWNVPKAIQVNSLKKWNKVIPNKILGGNPDNPLGDYAIYLGKKGYIIHGTNQPWSIGRFVSSGCMRLSRKDIKELFSLVKRGVPTHIVNHPIKAGWLKGRLYLKAQLPVLIRDQKHKHNDRSAKQVIEEAIKNHPTTIAWQHVRTVVVERSGIPTAIGHALPSPIEKSPHKKKASDAGKTSYAGPVAQGRLLDT